MPEVSSSDVFATGGSTGDDARLAAEIADFHLPDDARLDDRTRLAIGRTLAAVVGTVEADIRRHAARLLAARAGGAAADALAAGAGSAMARLTASGVLADRALMAELIAGTRAALIAEALPTIAAEADRPSLLIRLADLSDGVVTAAARALLAADNRVWIGGGDLPADLYHRLVWWVAAAIREGGSDAVDRALAEAAERCLAAHDESERQPVLAARLAAAIDPLPGEVPALLVEAIGDRRLALFVAILARSLGLDDEVARALTLDPAGDRLWSALRAVGMERPDIARVALSLADADPRRDIEAFADRLDAIAAIDPGAARASLVPLALPRAFRRAIGELAGGRR